MTLPRGRHQLSRDDVRTVQRDRIVDAVTAVMAERGYADTPVSAVLTAAGVSRETFYQLFDDKAAAFTAALEVAMNTLGEALLDVPTGGTPSVRLAALVERYLAVLTAEPARSRLFMVETFAAGPDARVLRVESQRAAGAFVAEVFGHVPGSAGHARAEVFVATVIALVTNRLVSTEPFDDLRPLLLDVAERLLT